jgi:hypothetical protein
MRLPPLTVKAGAFPAIRDIGDAVVPDDLSRVAKHDAMRWNVFKHVGTAGDPAAFANGHPHHDRMRPDPHVIFNDGMDGRTPARAVNPVTLSERDPMKERHIAADPCCGIDYHAAAVRQCQSRRHGGPPGELHTGCPAGEPVQGFGRTQQQPAQGAWTALRRLATAQRRDHPECRAQDQAFDHQPPVELAELTEGIRFQGVHTALPILR